jgi:hypothetical protein
MDGDKRYLFVCGCPRSGTTALWNLLTAAPDVVLGLERYGTRVSSAADWLAPELFQHERFFEWRAGDTFYDDLEAFHPYYRTARTQWHEAAIVGDKLPKLYARFQQLAEVFPSAKVVFLIRNIFDVAASYKKRAEDVTDATWRRNQGVRAAIVDWTQSIAAYQAASPRLDILPIAYEQLLVEGRGLQALCDWAGLAGRESVVARHRHLLARSHALDRDRHRSLTALETHDICMRAPFGGFRNIVERALERAAVA